MLGKGLHRGLAGVVGWVVARGIRDALLRAGDDDGGRVGGFHGREKGRDAVDDAEEVDVEDALERGYVGPGRRGLYAGVESEEVDLAWE